MTTEFEKECLRDARDEFREGNVIQPYIIGMHNQYGITNRLPVGHFMERQSTKDAIVDMLIGIVHKGASEIVFVSEIWRAQGKPEDRKEFERESMKWIKEHGSLGGFPGVAEYVMLTHFSDAGDQLHFAPISNRSEGRKLGRWEVQAEGEYESEGRFTGIFKRAREIQGN